MHGSCAVHGMPTTGSLETVRVATSGVRASPRQVRAQSTEGVSDMWRRRNTDSYDTESAVETKRGRHWSPAQFVSLLVGIAAVVFGIVALADTGIHGNWLRSPHREVWSFDHTPLLAVIEIAFGVVLILAAVSATGSRAVMALFGLLAVAFGILIV